MKIECAFLFALAVGTASIAAQSAGNQSSFGIAGMEPAQQVHTVVVIPPPAESRCPVSMRAQHLADGNVVKTGNDHPQGIGQKLHLTLRGPDTRQIARATMTVRGYSPKARAMKTSDTQNDSSDAIKSLTVKFSAAADRSASADIWISGMSAVQAIEIDSVTYIDGSNWKLAVGQSCRVTPDPLMLITNR